MCAARCAGDECAKCTCLTVITVANPTETPKAKMRAKRVKRRAIVILLAKIKRTRRPPIVPNDCKFAATRPWEVSHAYS